MIKIYRVGLTTVPLPPKLMLLLPRAAATMTPTAAPPKTIAQSHQAEPVPVGGVCPPPLEAEAELPAGKTDVEPFAVTLMPLAEFRTVTEPEARSA